MVGNKDIGEYGKATRFTKDNQPHNRGRKPKLYKQLKKLIGQSVGHELEKEDYFNVIRFLMERSPNELERLIKDENGQPIFDRIFGKATQPIEGDVNAQVTTTNSVDLSALSTEELLQYNALTEKIAMKKDGKK